MSGAAGIRFAIESSLTVNSEGVKAVAALRAIAMRAQSFEESDIFVGNTASQILRLVRSHQRPNDRMSRVVGGIFDAVDRVARPIPQDLSRIYLLAGMKPRPAAQHNLAVNNA